MPRLTGVTVKVADLRQQHPCMKAADIARRIGVSREGVRQALIRNGLPTRPPIQPRRACACGCGQPIYKPGRSYYSPEHRHNHLFVQIACSTCGTLKETLATRLISHTKRGYQFSFCSRRCLGVWMGKQNRGHSNRPRKYDYDKIWTAHIQTGYGAVRLSRLLGIDESRWKSVDHVLHRIRKSLKGRTPLLPY